MGIWDISAVLEISIGKALTVLTSSIYEIEPKHSHYDCLEIDEFWTYYGGKSKKYGLYLCISPGKRGDCGVYLGEPDTTAGNKL
jgi:hypothetical protein